MHPLKPSLVSLPVLNKNRCNRQKKRSHGHDYALPFFPQQSERLCWSSAGTVSTWPGWRWDAGAPGTSSSPSNTQESRTRSRWGRSERFEVNADSRTWSPVYRSALNVLQFNSCNIHDPLRMNFTDFCDPLTLPLLPPSCWHFCFLLKNVNHYQISSHEIQYRHSWSPEDRR